MDLSAKEIGKRIKQYRKEKGFTQKELAETIGCAEMTISQYERGLYSPKIDTRIALANALGVPYVELFAPVRFDSPEDFKKVWDATAQKPAENGQYQTVVRHRGDGTITNEAQYRFEASDLSEREYKVFDSLYSLLRNKDADAPK